MSGAYPEFAFWTTSGEAIFMLMLGGTQLFLGPLAGAVLLEALNHYIVALTEYHGLVLGCVLTFLAGLGAAWSGSRGIAARLKEYR